MHNFGIVMHAFAIALLSLTRTLTQNWQNVTENEYNITNHGRRHVGGRVGNRPPWEKSGWAMPTLEMLTVV